ncbi:sugar phosphate isomerase/epimerase family protein [Actinoplanes sp. CA-030573]|uniref:sugar phosphate isomerase/epimerase family protein n=1 Tax=Actinoplanes sp. CA-030573 TaxID=3239898 RepID=UPI003D8C61B3
MNDTLRWAYALNQWNFRLDVFVRHEDHRRALQTVSALGFDHVELAAGTGRWDNLGRPETIALNHGSPAAFLDFVRSCAVAGIAGFFWDPGRPVEEEGWAFRSTRHPGDHAAIVESARQFVDFLAAIGADRLVARPVGSAWMGPPLDAAAFHAIGEVWNRVGAVAAAAGIGLSLHYDCLGAVHTLADLKRLLAFTDPELVGLALDTAEFAVAGLDPVAFYRAHADRVTHVHLKDARYADTGSEYRMPAAETTMLRGGAGRRIERWFYELGTEGGLVDVKGFVAALREHHYPGWVVVESDHGGNPAELAMLNSWYLQHELGVTRSG